MITWPLVRLVKQLFLGFACINYNFAKKNKRLLEVYDGVYVIEGLNGVNR